MGSWEGITGPYGSKHPSGSLGFLMKQAWCDNLITKFGLESVQVVSSADHGAAATSVSWERSCRACTEPWVPVFLSVPVV